MNAMAKSMARLGLGFRLGLKQGLGLTLGFFYLEALGNQRSLS